MPLDPTIIATTAQILRMVFDRDEKGLQLALARVLAAIDVRQEDGKRIPKRLRRKKKRLEYSIELLKK